MKFFISYITLTTILFSCTINLNAQWIKTNGPFGGTMVSCFANTGKKLYAGSECKGVFLSTDNSESWKKYQLRFTGYRYIIACGNWRYYFCRDF